LHDYLLLYEQQPPSVYLSIIPNTTYQTTTTLQHDTCLYWLVFSWTINFWNEGNISRSDLLRAVHHSWKNQQLFHSSQSSRFEIIWLRTFILLNPKHTIFTSLYVWTLLALTLLEVVYKHFSNAFRNSFQVSLCLLAVISVTGCIGIVNAHHQNKQLS